MIRIKEAIVVEGRYDKNTLSQIVDAPIIETSGFGIMNDKAQLAFLRRVAESRGLISKKAISLMKKDVIIVNEARGAVVNEDDITDAVLDGRIGAYGSDVYTTEPFSSEHPFAKIMNLPNVLLTPHAAWGAYEARKRCIDVVVNNIAAFVRGEIENRVDI